MAKALYTNNAETALASAINSVVTSLSVTGGDGALFPNPSGGDYYYATIQDDLGNIEIVKVTSRTTDTFDVIIRGADGTTALVWNDPTNTVVELRLVKAGIDELANLNSPSNTFTGNLSASDVTATDQFKSTVATGTAPIVVASTTKVTNLNADLLDGANTSEASSASTIPIRNADQELLAVRFVGNLTGDVLAADDTSVLDSGTDGTDAVFTGDVTGDLTGNVTGDLTGDVTGNLTLTGAAEDNMATFSAAAQIQDSGRGITEIVNTLYNFGDGSDGAVTHSSNTTLTGGEFNYTTYALNTGITLDIDSGEVLIIRATTSITVTGTIDLTGITIDGFVNNSLDTQDAGGGAGGGGGSGSAVTAGTTSSANTAESTWINRLAGGAGGAGVAATNNGNAGVAGAAATSVDYQGAGFINGSHLVTGGGNGTDGTDGLNNSVINGLGGAGGAAGGAVFLIAPTILIEAAGSIDVQGQDGVAGGNLIAGGGGGGGGGGGFICLVGNSITNSGSTDVTGGAAGAAGNGSSQDGGAGAAGGAGLLLSLTI